MTNDVDDKVGNQVFVTEISESEELKVLKKPSRIWDDGNLNYTKGKTLERRENVTYPHKIKDLEEIQLLYKNLNLTPDGINSDYIGKFPAKIGSRPFKLVSLDINIISFFHLFQERYRKWYPKIKIGNHKIASGSFETSKKYYERMMTGYGPYDQSQSSPDKFNNFWGPMLKEYLYKLQITELPAPSVKDIDLVEVNGKSGPGARWQYLMGFSKNEQCVQYAKILAKQNFYYSSRKLKSPTMLYTCGAKETRVDDALEDGKELETRGILAPELQETIFNSLYSRPIEKYYFEKEAGPVYLGQSMAHDGWRRLKRDLDFGDFCIEGDWRKFDNYVTGDMLLLGMSVLRTFYPKNSRVVDFHFMRMTAGLRNKYLITPGGYSYEITKGMPSGTSWTAILNTIMNFLILSKLCQDKLNCRHANDVRMVVGGDDFVLSFKNESRVDPSGISLEKLIEYCGMSLNMELKVFSLKSTDAVLPEDAPTFYGISLYNGRITLNPSRILELILGPRSAKRNSWDYFNYLSALNTQGIYPEKWFCLLFDLMAFSTLMENRSFNQKTYSKYYLIFKKQLLYNYSQIGCSNVGLNKLTLSEGRPGKMYVKDGHKVNLRIKKQMIEVFGVEKGAPKSDLFSSQSNHFLRSYTT